MKTLSTYKVSLIATACVAVVLSLLVLMPSSAFADGNGDYEEVYRLYNPNSGEHFYCMVNIERDNLINEGWIYEGVGWVAPRNSSTPVYRLYNHNAGDHHYTTSAEERDWLMELGWAWEGVAFMSDEDHRIPIYREYNPNAIAGAHNYTMSVDEHNYLGTLGWHKEGIGWYASYHGLVMADESPYYRWY